MRHRLLAQFCMLTGALVLTAPLSCSSSVDWEEVQIADALRAAPPAVTHNAKIYAWQPYGQLVLVRNGDGPYICVASGSSSLRFGKPPLPYPDPFCADQNAWAFIKAFWEEPDSDPLEPAKPLPRAPGLVWMLSRMQVGKGQVPASKDARPLVQTGHTGVAQRAGQAAADTIPMSPQLIILPLPIDPATMDLPGASDPTHPLTLWMMARDTPIGHVPVHFSEVVHQTLMNLPPDPAR
jgi:hypothetical protein